MKKTTILALGDFTSSGKPFCRSFERFIKLRKRLPEKFSRMEIEDYATLLAGIYPKILTEDILVVNFFPYNYWNDYIEIYDKDDRVYGDDNFGKDFADFFRDIKNRLKRYYKNHRVDFVNDLKNITVDRDKKTTKIIFCKNKIPTPRMLEFKKINDVEKAVKQGYKIYAKPRFGAMGKGITFFSEKKWLTNFRIEKNKIISKVSDYGWKFHNITGNKSFLKEILDRNFLFEEAISSATINRRRFDLRLYVVCGKIPYYYARSTKSTGIVTNWTQGGRIEPKNFLNNLPSGALDIAKEYALKAARLLNFNFAGIDVLMSKDFKDVYVLEVQSFPGYEKGFDLFRFLIKNIYK